jgi:predicted O-methyltransferase YrrM
VELAWESDQVLRIGDIEFLVGAFERKPSHGKEFTLLKTRSMVESYRRLLDEVRPEHMVELGIFHGGSAVLFDLLARPRRLVAIEFSPVPIAALEEYIAEHGEGRVSTHYGVDQADTETVLGIVERTTGSLESLDLVIDDASHELDLTRRSFDALFPALRPGGVYVIEDWSWGHFPFAKRRSGPSLAKLVMELVLAVPFSPGLIESIRIDAHCAEITRGGAALDGSRFSLAEHYGPRAKQLLAVEDHDPRE